MVTDLSLIGENITYNWLLLKDIGDEMKEYVNWNSFSNEELSSISVNSYNLQGDFCSLNVACCYD